MPEVDYIAGGATQNSIRVAQWMLQVIHSLANFLQQHAMHSHDGAPDPVQIAPARMPDSAYMLLFTSLL